jgi:methionyl-tRNA formyltransferase
VKIAFFGLPLAALMLLADGHELAIAALPRKQLPGTRRLRRALGSRLLITPRVDDAFELPEVDLVVSWFWTKKLPRHIVSRPGFGVHPSLLPRWRGPDPYFWAIDSGDAVTGVTAHRLDVEYDTGALLGRRSLPIDPAWNAWQLARALDRPSLALLREVARTFSEIREEAQDETLVTLAPEPSEELLEIDWRRDAAAIERRIRAASPYPGAWTFIGDEALVITRASVRSRPHALGPGEAAVVEGRAVVAAGDGAVILHSGRRIDDVDPTRPEQPGDHEEPLDEAGISALVERAMAVS